MSAKTTEPAWLTIARGELGVEETPGPLSNAKIEDYFEATTLGRSTDDVPWCSAFVNWVMIGAGIQGSGKANARSWLDWGFPIIKPEIGCICIFSRGSNQAQGHVGFYVGENENSILVLGGNQNNMVCIKEYKKSDLLGYRWPHAG